ncbi:hypothetical protein TNCV_3328871 [Trichonephila clavipes]|nr:hypothetical protein TNCV_3328871 [Trichonephila clavipes]
MGKILEATILIGKFQGEVVLLPRIPMIPSDSPIPFKRSQFPIRLAFAKSQANDAWLKLLMCRIAVCNYQLKLNTILEIQEDLRCPDS